VKRTPRHIRDEAVSDLIKAYNSNLAKRTKKNGNKPPPHIRTYFYYMNKQRSK